MNEITKQTQSASARFTDDIMAEFQSITGQTVKFSENKKRLAQHIFVKVDAALKDLEAKRLNNGKNTITSYSWSNVNLSKLSLDAVHRIEIGLDALISNHISVIPYFNKKSGKYDIDLQIGYTGKDYYKRKLALDATVDILYELVYEEDELVVMKKDHNNEVETYTFKIKNPFKRGKIVGGFGYISYENDQKNKLVIVSEEDFINSMNLAKTPVFWKNNPAAMRYKTIVNRVTDKILVDPEKMNESYHAIEEQEQNDVVAADEAEQIIEIDMKETVKKDVVTEQKQEEKQKETNTIKPDW